jgi:hypothetical protein
MPLPDRERHFLLVVRKFPTAKSELSGLILQAMTGSMQQM